MVDARRRLPQVDKLVAQLGQVKLPRPMVVDTARSVLGAARTRARRTGEVPTQAALLAECREELERRRAGLLRPLVNATGVLLHTNLGRAPLSEEAIRAVVAVARGYSNLEWDASTGRRGDRFEHVEPLLALAAGAEAALVVNNNAAAVLLVCAALAAGREVVISRGELIEIGGSFRIPEVLEVSGAHLREIGTTNRTHLRDYERAIGDQTALVLKVHPSNYRVVGFTEAPSTPELAELTRRRRVPLVYDTGSGLLDREVFDEPVVTDVVAEGADLVCFSGDKLFGGPQAGIVVGRKRLVARLRSHPFLRAVRPDKMQLAALGETARAYLEERAGALPLWRMIDLGAETLRRRLSKLASALAEASFTAEVVDAESVTGGGSLPGHGIPGPVMRVTHPHRTPKRISAALASHDPPVVVRVERRAVVVDLRTVDPSDDDLVAAALLANV